MIDHTGGLLCYTPLKTSKIIMACFILHNICRRKKIPYLSDDGHTETSHINEEEEEENHAENSGWKKC